MRTHTHTSPGSFPGPGRLWCLEYRAVFDTVLVNAHKVQGLCVTGGGAGHQALQPFAHEPLARLGCHLAGDVLLGPFVHPGLEPLVQPLAHSFVGLQKQKRCYEEAAPALGLQHNTALGRGTRLRVNTTTGRSPQGSWEHRHRPLLTAGEDEDAAPVAPQQRAHKQRLGEAEPCMPWASSTGIVRAGNTIATENEERLRGAGLTKAAR